MKKLLFVSLIALSLNASAQTEKGSWMIGGELGNINLGFGKSTTDFSIGVDPIGLYFITDNLGIGGRIPIGIGVHSTKDVSSITTFQIGIAPTIRYYFTEIGKGKIFGEAALDFLNTSTSTKDKILNTSSSSSNSATGFSIGLGYNYFFNPHVALEAGLRYVNVSDDNAPYNATNTFGGFNENNINFNLGLNIFFPQRAKNSVKSLYKKKK